MARILVIEDERDLQRILDYNLRKAGHDVLQALRGQDGLDLARRSRPDLVLLDLMLPDLQGTEICKILKADPATKDIPVVMLTAKGEEIDRVLGFELGVEDYVVKPFSLRELILRLQVVLRRKEPSTESGVTRFGRLRIDHEAHRVWVDGEEARLTLTEFRLLVTLYERRNRVQSRITLLEDVWGMNAEAETRTVDTHVKRLREKLGSAEAYIETVRGAGYRFLGTPPEGDA
ncbi:MAG TPA: winged helix-turn-helix domain-containing protein [Holophaga sp.]|nr:winged helix-turn-helix domain-containing protein [Holophaga sp.]HPS67690.1 winged helix-turn-helix domain-containing protein [Holophaga sp.]